MSNHHVDERLSCGCEVCIDSAGMSYLVQCALHLAAPDLLAACEAFVAWSNDENDEYVDELIQVTKQTRTAIAKAKGE